jgi:branched-chain amino acid transport system permease protein
MSAGRRATPAVALVAAVALPFFFDPASAFVGDCILALAYTMVALGLNIIVGFAGLLDLGYVAAFAVGAYTAAWLGSGFFSEVGNGRGWHVLVSGFAGRLPGIHVTFLLVLVAALVLTTIVGMVVGLPTLHLRGDYIAIVTLASGEIIGRLAANGDDVRLAGLPLVGGPLGDELGSHQTFTAGPQGITPIDKVRLPFAHVFTSLDLRPWYWLALALATLVLIANVRLRDSRLGRAWVALRDDEVAAVSMGVPAARTKLLAYGASAGFGGIAGAFLASFNNIVSADQFQFGFSILILGMVVLGGLASIRGVIAGAIVLTFINFWLLPDVLNTLPRRIGDAIGVSIGIDMSAISTGIYGFLLVTMMLLRPQGLWPARPHARARF